MTLPHVGSQLSRGSVSVAESGVTVRSAWVSQPTFAQITSIGGSTNSHQKSQCKIGPVVRGTAAQRPSGKCSSAEDKAEICGREGA